MDKDVVCVCIHTHTHTHTHIFTMKYYSAIKKNETVPFSATWMDMKYIIPSEVSHTKTNII